MLTIFGQISDLYFLTIFGKKSKQTAVKSDQNFFSKNPATPKFQKYPPGRRNFCPPPNLGVINLDPKKSSDNYACACFLTTILRYIEFSLNFQRNFLTICDPVKGSFDPIGAFLGSA